MFSDVQCYRMNYETSQLRRIAYYKQALRPKPELSQTFDENRYWVKAYLKVYMMGELMQGHLGSVCLESDPTDLKKKKIFRRPSFLGSNFPWGDCLSGIVSDTRND